MGKTDIHLHLMPATLSQNLISPTGKQSFASGKTPHPTGPMKISGSVDMIPHLHELGITKGVIMSMGMKGTEASRIAAGLAPDTYRWMCNLNDGELTTLEEVEAYFTRCREQGAVGVGEFAINRWIDDPYIDMIFTAAENVGLPLLFHMSPEQGFNYGVADQPGLPMLEKALQRHPNLIIIGHSQPFWHEITGDAGQDLVSRNSWGEGPVTPGGRTVELLRKYPNLYGDLSANSGGNAIMRDEAFGLAFLEEFQDRLMFGSDMTNTEMEFPLGRYLDKILAEGKISQQVYNKVCFENAARILGV